MGVLADGISAVGHICCSEPDAKSNSGRNGEGDAPLAGGQTRVPVRWDVSRRRRKVQRPPRGLACSGKCVESRGIVSHQGMWWGIAVWFAPEQTCAVRLWMRGGDARGQCKWGLAHRPCAAKQAWCRDRHLFSLPSYGYGDICAEKTGVKT